MVTIWAQEMLEYKKGSSSHRTPMLYLHLYNAARKKKKNKTNTKTGTRLFLNFFHYNESWDNQLLEKEGLLGHTVLNYSPMLILLPTGLWQTVDHREETVVVEDAHLMAAWKQEQKEGGLEPHSSFKGALPVSLLNVLLHPSSTVGWGPCLQRRHLKSIQGLMRWLSG